MSHNAYFGTGVETARPVVKAALKVELYAEGRGRKVVVSVDGLGHFEPKDFDFVLPGIHLQPDVPARPAEGVGERLDLKVEMPVASRLSGRRTHRCNKEKCSNETRKRPHGEQEYVDSTNSK
jgi:hypothetical protein